MTLLQTVEEGIAKTINAFTATDLINIISVGDREMNIPVGSSLPFFEYLTDGGQGGKGKAGNLEYFFPGHYLKRDEQLPSAELIQRLTGPWLNAPYLWGGRSPLGVDCSGFVQVVFKLMGIDLPRDAWQQAQEGKPVKKFADSQVGDLAFFDNKEDIVHVGILLGEGRIIHASGKVRIDGIDKKGITSKDTGSPNTRLRAIRRYW
jgi:hypothetical protein